jgi:signal transduction histidine kinase
LGGHVGVSLQFTTNGPSVEITDTGPGIPLDLRKSVLQRFYRAPEARNVPGSGLGLNLVEAVVRLHDFALVLDEADGGGLRARILCWRQESAG